MRINDITVSTLDNVPITSTALMLCGSSKPTVSTSESDCPIWLWDRDVLPTTLADGTAVTGNVLTPTATAAYLNDMMIVPTSYIAARSKTRNKNLLNSPCSRLQYTRFNWKPNFGLFDSDHRVQANSRISFEFNVSNQYAVQFFNGVIFDGTTIPPSSIISTSPPAVGQITLAIQDMSMYMSIHETYENPTKHISMRVSEAWTSYKSLSASNDTLSYMIPPSTYKLLVCFVDSQYQNNTATSPSDFGPVNHSNLAIPFASILQSISVGIAGEVNPMYPYNWPNGLYSTTPATDTGDAYRAYREAMYSMEAYSDMSGSIYDEVTWSYNPIFVMRIFKQSSDVGKNLDVRVQCLATPVSINCVVIALYHREIGLAYDQHSVLSNVMISDLI